MLEVVDGAPGELQRVLDGEGDLVVSDDDVTTLGKRRDHGGRHSEVLAVQTAGIGAEEVGEHVLAVVVDVLVSVEARGPAGADTVVVDGVPGDVEDLLSLRQGQEVV